MKQKIKLLGLLAGLCSGQYVSAQLKVNVKNPVAEVSPVMWGVFFEDINMGADGGIYAELVKNRSFEFYKPLMGWTVQQKHFREGTVIVQNRQGKESANPRYIQVLLDNTSKGELGLTNEGFRGMGVKNAVRYDFSLQYRTENNGIKLHVELVDEAGKILGGETIELTPTNGKWTKKKGVGFVAGGTAMKGKLNIWLEGNGKVDLDMLSLFPSDTWKGRPGGMRADMIQMLADMKPGFIRFPGGCIVEGHDLSLRYQWKKTIGPVEERQLIVNRWNTEFAHRPTPDYYQTFGLGFFEYFQIAEDIGAEPLPILNCGMACQFNTAEVVPMDELGPYVQDALDLIEFANGDANTPWGKKRAEMGHPAPFNLKMLGIGNENWGPQYLERLAVFQKAIKAKYPEFKIVGSSGTDPDGDRFNLLDTAMRRMKVDIIDEHYYRRPEWFLQNASRYDKYDRNGPKIFAGEYAAQSDKTVSVKNENNWQTALAEAAFLTGLERNAGVIHMASYAPLFAHIDGWQWRPDMIWVDNLRIHGTPNYYVQKLYSTNKGTHTLSITGSNGVPAGRDSLYASAVLDQPNKEVIVKLVNASGSAKEELVQLDGAKPAGKTGTVVVMKNELSTVNTLDNPEAVVPSAGTLPVKGNKISITLPPYSLTVVKILVK